jgi:NAD-dependent dihydropyrimidine dehydrogenase PreA subunit
MPEIRIDELYCVGCGECIEACPQSGENKERPVWRRGEGNRPQLENVDNCIQCFSCVEICRARAISINGSRRVAEILVGEEIGAKTRNVY